MVGIKLEANLHTKRESAHLSVISAELFGLSVAMLPCFFIDLLEKASYLTFLIPILAGIVLSSVIGLMTKMPETIKSIDGLFLLGIVWIVAIIFSAIPFMISGISLADSIFESTSNITTSGATIVNVRNISSGLFMWRSIMEWIGGLAVIMLFTLLLPMFGFGSKELLDSSTSFSSDVSTLTLRKRDIARQFLCIYAFLTASMVLLLSSLDVPLFDSLCESLATISTGGPTSKYSNFSEFPAKIKIICGIFMLLGSINFFLHFRALYYKRSSTYFNNEEFRFVLFWNLTLVVLIYILIHCDHIIGGDFNLDFVDIVVAVISATSTTFFVDFEYWPEIATTILLFAAFLGGSAGSTTGGIKISRIIVILRYIQNGLKSILHPEAVYEVRLNKGSVGNRTINVVAALSVLFLFTTLAGISTLMIFGHDLQSSLLTTIALITTSGSSFSGTLGLPIHSLNWFLKIFLCFIMLLGRLEILSGIILLTPRFWKEFIHSVKRMS
ncbi:MAG: hypothetical protein MJY64_01815 [archaeon]|nr:hypothetical protein [archaeon]